MEKVTMKDIADALNISRVTVSKAFNNQAGVSDALRETIFDKARELGYTKLPYQAQTGSQAPAAQEERTVALVVSRPESSFFWTGIIHRMAQELSEYNINLMYVYVPSTFTRDFVLPSVLFGSTLSGIAVVNVYDPVILGMVNDLPLPKVFLDTIPTLTDRKLNGDLLLIEGYRTEAEITESLILDGHKEIRLGSLTPTRDFNYVKDTAAGFMAIAACPDAVGQEINIATEREISIGDLANELIRQIAPDARIVCEEQRLRPEKSEVNRLLGSAQKLRQLTGWQPAYTFEEGLAQTVAWFRQHREGYRSDIYNL